MSSEIYTIKFLPSGKEIKDRAGKTIFEAAQSAGIYIESPCGGNGKCGKCRVMVAEGMVSPSTAEEAALIPEKERASGVRLACRMKPESNTAIFIPDEYVLTREVSKKTFSGQVETVRPAVAVYTLQLPRSEAGRELSEQMIADLLREQHGLDAPAIDKSCLERQKASKSSRFTRTAYVWMDREVIRLDSGSVHTMLGAAVDIGTTTVAVYLCDLHTGEVAAGGSFANPQIAFGADVISRIAYSVRNPGSGIEKMRGELLSSINAMLDELTANIGSDPSRILDMTVVGNTVMHHIFLGVRPDELGISPFRPSIMDSRDVKARQLGLTINPGSYVHVLPVEAGFVGADNVAVILSEEPHLRDEPSLIIDIGTNGEIVLGNRKHLYSCSCATGPALEGAGISQGMRAVRGAIEGIRIDRSTFEVDYKIVGEVGWTGDRTPDSLRPAGICGSAVIDAVAEFYSSGIIDANGTFKEGLSTPRLRKNSEGIGEFVLVWRKETGIATDITITQRDIRQFQLAKAALRTGCEILMKHYGIESIERIVIAGAFGVHIDKSSAVTTGLFPPCNLDSIEIAGNAAGRGAYLALMDLQKREEADVIARKTTYVELASDPDFTHTFMKALHIPYKE